MECIPVWNRCNNRCLMCSNPPDYKRIGKYSLQALKARVAGFAKDETDIYLTGGEPSLHPGLFELLGYIRGRFPAARIVMDTNGRMFAYADFAARCAALGNIEFQVSLCGHDARTHDAVTMTGGSFSQTVAGIKNLLRLRGGGAAVEVRFVLSRMSLPHIGKVYELARRRLAGIKALVFIFMEMEGMAAVNEDRVALRYQDAVGLVAKLFASVGPSPFELRLYHFPLCVLPVKLWSYAWRTLPEKEIVFPRRCARCRVKVFCLGVHAHYVRRYGGGEFQPLSTAPEIVSADDVCHPIRSAS